MNKANKKKDAIAAKKGWMEEYGYVKIKEQSATQRHKVLKLILKDIPADSLYMRLNAISLKLKNTSPESSALFKQDAEYVKKLSKQK